MQMLIARPHCAEFASYLADPYRLDVRKRDLRLYKYLSIKNVPAARDIRLIQQSAKKLQHSNPEEI